MSKLFLTINSLQDSKESLRLQGCPNRNIRIYHECEGWIEKSVPRIAVWHYEACQVMPNGDLEGRIFLSYPHTNNRFFFLLTTVLFIYLYIHLFNLK